MMGTELPSAEGWHGQGLPQRLDTISNLSEVSLFLFFATSA